MAKDKTVYVCDYCGQESVKWMGKCPACGRWGTMKEIKVSPQPSLGGGKAKALSQRGSGEGAVPLHQINAGAEPRIDMGDGELNRDGYLILGSHESILGASANNFERSKGFYKKKQM